MDCVNHPGVNATAYCQHCGKAICDTCTRQSTVGQVLCDPCQAAWQAYQQPIASTLNGNPNPGIAAVLGLIPGVGAMYNGQFFKGLAHIVIFVILISLSERFPLFGILIAGWVFYQVFEAYHVAKARREGSPMPDPLGLNDMAGWFNMGTKSGTMGNWGPGVSSQNVPPTNPNPYTAQEPQAAPYGQQQPSGFYPPQPPYPPPPGVVDPNMPPVHTGWRRREPIGALTLIGLGILLLLNHLNIFHGWIFKFTWPLLLIGLGVWLIVRRMSEHKGDQK